MNQNHPSYSPPAPWTLAAISLLMEQIENQVLEAPARARRGGYKILAAISAIHVAAHF